MHGENRGVYRVLVGKPEGKRPLGRTRRRWYNNMRMDLQELRGKGIEWIDVAQDRDRWRAQMNAVKRFRVP
jgi:hypothetical protein